MSTRLRENASFLDLVRTAEQRQCKKLICTSCKNQIDVLSELCWNIVHGNVNLTPSQVGDLRKHRSLVYRVADKRNPWRSKKRWIQQVGGFPPLLAAIAAPLIASIAGSVIDRAIRR